MQHSVLDKLILSAGVIAIEQAGPSDNCYGVTQLSGTRASPPRLLLGHVELIGSRL